MTLILKFGDDTLGPVRTLAVKREGLAPDTVEQWKAAVDVEAATPEALETILQPMRDAQGTEADLKLVHGGAEVRGLDVSSARHGPTLAAVEAQDAAPGEAHNRRRVTLTFRATLQDAAAVQSHEFTVREITSAGAPARIVTQGKAVLRRGEDPADHEDALIPGSGGGYRRVRRDVTRDANGPSLNYITEDEQVFTTLPGGVDDGHYVVTETLADGAPVRVTAGFFVGASAVARALELRPGEDRLAGSRVSTNPFTRRVDFEFREFIDDGGAVASSESLTFVTTRRVIDHPLLDGQRPAYRQHVGAPQSEVVQEGSAVGNGRHATPRLPRRALRPTWLSARFSIPCRIPACPRTAAG